MIAPKVFKCFKSPVYSMPSYFQVTWNYCFVFGNVHGEFVIYHWDQKSTSSSSNPDSCFILGVVHLWVFLIGKDKPSPPRWCDTYGFGVITNEFIIIKCRIWNENWACVFIPSVFVSLRRIFLKFDPDGYNSLLRKTVSKWDSMVIFYWAYLGKPLNYIIFSFKKRNLFPPKCKKD